MKRIKWIGEYVSAMGVCAIVEVEPGEAADIEFMLQLVDGDAERTGLAATLVALDEPPRYGTIAAQSARLKFKNAAALSARKRYYEISGERGQ